jgi:hypothetical protein
MTGTLFWRVVALIGAPGAFAAAQNFPPTTPCFPTQGIQLTFEGPMWVIAFLPPTAVSGATDKFHLWNPVSTRRRSEEPRQLSPPFRDN